MAKYVTLSQSQTIANGVIAKVKAKGYAVEADLGALAKKSEVAKADLAAALAKIIDDVVAESAGNKTAIETLNGTAAGSIKKQIDDAFNDFATKVSDDSVVNTYKELIDYAAAHGTEYTALIGEVSALTSKLALGKYEDAGEQKEYATVKAYVEAYVASQISAAALDQGDGIEITNGTVSAKVHAANGLSVDSNDGIKMAAVVASVNGNGGSNGAMTAAQAEKLASIEVATAEEIAQIVAGLDSLDED